LAANILISLFYFLLKLLRCTSNAKKLPIGLMSLSSALIGICMQVRMNAHPTKKRAPFFRGAIYGDRNSQKFVDLQNTHFVHIIKSFMIHEHSMRMNK